MKSNLPIYIDQLQIQRYSKNPDISVKAVEVLSILDKKIKANTGKTIRQSSKEDLENIPFDINAKTKEHKQFWGIDRLFSYEESAHFLGFFGKKNREKRKKFFSNVGKAVTSVTQTIAKIATAPTMVPLLPFLPAMKKRLQKKGIKPEKGPHKLAEQFYKNIIKSYDYSNYEHYYTELEGQKEAGLLPLATIIPAILAFFKMIKDKIANNAASPEDQETMQDVAAEQNKLDTNKEYKAEVLQQNSMANTQSGPLGGNNLIFIAIFIAIILYVRR